MKFIGRKISLENELVGQQLKTQREQKEILLEDASKKLEINIKYLKALEESRYRELPKGIYSRNFLKKYTLFLGLNWEKIKKDYEIETGENKKIVKKYSFSLPRLKKIEFLLLPKLIRNIGLAIIVVIFFIYIGFYLKNSFSTPEINIIEPSNNFITSNNSITVIGKADNNAQITINGKAVLNDEDGFFRQEIDLKSGINTITVIAQKKYGQKKVITRQILVE